jgi:hypothetical protein
VDGTFGDVVVADALRELSTRDPKLGELINRHGTLPRIFACQDSRRATHEPNRAFRSLARAIVFQQLNGTAAATIFGRVLRCVGAEDDDPAFSLTPDAIIDADEAQMRACGLSQRKYEYLVSLASAFHPSHSDYPLTDESLEAMDDEEVDVESSGVERRRAVVGSHVPDVLPEQAGRLTDEGFRRAQGRDAAVRAEGHAERGEG